MSANPSGIRIVPSVAPNRGSDSIRIVPRPAAKDPESLLEILPENLFLGMLCLERKRAERSRKTFLLLLINVENVELSRRRSRILEGVIEAADAARRDTDPAGWYKHNSILGIVFTELGALDNTAIVQKFLDKMRNSLRAHLREPDLPLVHVSAHIFPDDSDDLGRNVPVNPLLYPDAFHLHESKKFSQVMKRVMDVVGSLLALILLSPLFLLIALAIKLTSKGPVFFRQDRLAKFGANFRCLKFRSMYADNDPKIHQEFMKRVIAGSHVGSSATGSKPVYKMTDDPRITRIGRILRRTSLDELPQFINVLGGEMSLVGPRPPLAYEFEEYDFWHRRRVLEVKPGITGLWQVNGRSRVKFDDMVRLDLQYARGWSLWLDIRILAQTPRAVVFGDGAY